MLSHLCAMDSLDSPLVQHLLTVQWSAWQLSLFDPLLANKSTSFGGNQTHDRAYHSTTLLTIRPLQLGSNYKGLAAMTAIKRPADVNLRIMQTSKHAGRGSGQMLPEVQHSVTSGYTKRAYVRKKYIHLYGNILT